MYLIYTIEADTTKLMDAIAIQKTSGSILGKIELNGHAQ